MVVRDRFPDRFLGRPPRPVRPPPRRGPVSSRTAELRAACSRRPASTPTPSSTRSPPGGPLSVVKESTPRPSSSTRSGACRRSSSDDQAVFVRLMNRPEGDGRSAAATVERVLDLLDVARAERVQAHVHPPLRPLARLGSGSVAPEALACRACRKPPPFDRRMTDAEGLMWRLEKDPFLRSNVANVTIARPTARRRPAPSPDGAGDRRSCPGCASASSRAPVTWLPPVVGRRRRRSTSTSTSATSPCRRRARCASSSTWPRCSPPTRSTAPGRLGVPRHRRARGRPGGVDPEDAPHRDRRQDRRADLDGPVPRPRARRPRAAAADRRGAGRRRARAGARPRSRLLREVLGNGLRVPSARRQAAELTGRPRAASRPPDRPLLRHRPALDRRHAVRHRAGPLDRCGPSAPSSATSKCCRRRSTRRRTRPTSSAGTLNTAFLTVAAAAAGAYHAELGRAGRQPAGVDGDQHPHEGLRGQRLHARPPAGAHRRDAGGRALRRHPDGRPTRCGRRPVGQPRLAGHAGRRAAACAGAADGPPADPDRRLRHVERAGGAVPALHRRARRCWRTTRSDRWPVSPST